MKYDAYVFDFDFTLIDAFEPIRDSVNFALAAQGLGPAPDGDIRKTVGMTLADVFRALTGIRGEEQARAFTARFREKADEVMADKTAFLPGALNLLERLKAAGAATAIVTNKFHYRIDQVLRKFEAERLIDLIVGFEDVAEPKPAPEGLLVAIDALNVPRGRALYVGDSAIDAQTARAAGVDFAGVTTGAAGRDELAAYPHAVIAENLDQLASGLIF
ncbi:MAG: HAD-IA family hydrolase [Firmicutes bacterium]|nr:HAD-IA family hydrolase [Bacillota bacterium]